MSTRHKENITECLTDKQHEELAQIKYANNQVRDSTTLGVNDFKLGREFYTAAGK